MSSSGEKRLTVSFGDFYCEIAGYEDPANLLDEVCRRLGKIPGAPFDDLSGVLARTGAGEFQPATDTGAPETDITDEDLFDDNAALDDASLDEEVAEAEEVTEAVLVDPVDEVDETVAPLDELMADPAPAPVETAEFDAGPSDAVAETPVATMAERPSVTKSESGVPASIARALSGFGKAETASPEPQFVAPERQQATAEAEPIKETVKDIGRMVAIATGKSTVTPLAEQEVEDDSAITLDNDDLATVTTEDFSVEEEAWAAEQKDDAETAANAVEEELEELREDEDHTPLGLSLVRSDAEPAGGSVDTGARETSRYWPFTWGQNQAQDDGVKIAAELDQPTETFSEPVEEVSETAGMIEFVEQNTVRVARADEAEAVESNEPLVHQIDDGGDAEMEIALEEIEPVAEEPSVEVKSAQPESPVLAAILAARREILGDDADEGEKAEAPEAVVTTEEVEAPEAVSPKAEVEDKLVLNDAMPVEKKEVETVSSFLMSAAKPVEEPIDKRFESFLIRVGAESAPELMEATAAFLTIADEQERFRQEEVMGRLAKTQRSLRISKQDQSTTFRSLVKLGSIVPNDDGTYSLDPATRFGYKVQMSD